jgi:aspartate-semialdehyde dehydrogenase
MPRVKGLIVGVVGATGMVGREFVALLEKRRFPVGELRPFSSGRKKSSVRFKGRSRPCPTATSSSSSAPTRSR